jgi:ribose transport system permease protein
MQPEEENTMRNDANANHKPVRLDWIKGMMHQLQAFLALIILCIVMTILTDNFFTLPNLVNVLMQNTIICIIAMGMTFVILMGGIDLSVGSNVAVAGLVLAMMMKYYHMPIAVSILIAIAISGAIGFINGGLITGFNLPPFIVTLGTMSAGRGLAQTLTNGAIINGFDESFKAIAGNVIGIPVPIIIMFIIFLLLWYMLKYTKVGRYSYAVGGNEMTCVLSGIKVKKYKLIVYTLLGVLCGVAAVILDARLDSALSTNASGYEMTAIAAVVIGGTSMSGGEGTLVGTLIGTYLMGVVNNGLSLLIVPSGIQQMFLGGIIVLAVCIDQMRKGGLRRTKHQEK